MLLLAHCVDGCMKMTELLEYSGIYRTPRTSLKKKFVAGRAAIFLQSLYPANVIINVLFGLAALPPSVIFTMMN